MNYFIGIFIIVIGIAAIYAGGRVNKLARRIKKFSFTIPAEISMSIVEAKTFHRNIRDPYTLVSSYSFYEKNTLNKGNATYDISLTGAEVAFHRKDAEKEKQKIENSNEVWFNPQDPSENFLCKTNLKWYLLVPPLGYLMCFIGMIVLLNEIFG